MKNTLSITKNDICSCVDSVADGTNSIFVAVDVGNVVNPQCKVWLNDTLKSTVELITNEINYVNLPPDLFIANGVIKFQYLDSAYTGQIFTINFPVTLEGNLSVTKTSDYVFTAKYTKSGVVTITVDSALSTTSENPVQNKVITNTLSKKQDAATAITTSNIGLQSVTYATSAGSIPNFKLSIWLPYNGYDLNNEKGWFAYSVNPGLKPSIGLPDSNRVSHYGTIFGVSNSTTYRIVIYVSVFGEIATWAPQDGKWRKYTSNSVNTT